MNPTDDDDEWEYEYDATETETFYLALDLSNVPAAQIPMVSQGRPGHPTLLKSRLRALNAARGQPVEFGGGDAGGGHETATMGEVQVLDLHTANPLVVYNGQLLSCHWTATVGTDLFFAKPDEGVTQALRALPAVDLLALGSAKLVAKVGRLRPREDGGVAADAAEGLGAGEADAHRVSAHEGEKDSTSFLARLNEAKAKRGETSKLALSKTPDGPRLVAEKADGLNGDSLQTDHDVNMDDA